MTKVSIYSDGTAHEIMAKEHATGSPEACAAISTLMYSLAGWAENNRKHLKTAPYYDLQPADAYILFDGDAEAAAAFELVEIGMLQLEKSYPEYISVEIVEKT